ncbi:MAG: class I SAM-dependent methyltransferase [Deltaproteobacteria bacterium]|nr:class I SAM-dependent methyltransferase [Deltaproteobacteria bacterium]
MSRMIDGRPSETALEVAAARAAHLRFDPEPHLLEDVHAESLLDEDGRALIRRYGDDGPWILKENRLFLPLRARFVEDRLVEAHARGCRQLVILGAGLDSFAWRQPEGLADLRIYEVDHPATQAWKVERLASLGWAVPANVRLVACDFESQTASKALAATGFDASSPALVSWMGVVYYLERETADGAMTDLAGLLAPGSEVVFDAMLPWESMPPRYHEIRDAMTAYLKGADEPHVNRYEPEEILAALAEAGFSEASVADRDELAGRYVDPTGTTIPLSERFMLVVARR